MESVTCEACAVTSYGAYDFNCRRCMARAYVRAFPREQRVASQRWRAELAPDEQDEMRRLINEERAREE